MFEPRHGAAYLREVEKSRLAEQDVSQEHGATGQYLNLVFTVMMTPQELTKVPTGERTSSADERGSARGQRTKREQLKLNLLQNTREPCREANNFSGERKEKNSLILQDGFDHCLCNDKAVGVHHAILSTNLSCTYKSREG